ncbi:MAG: TonB family protein [Betaproteobacteria bacterium]|nr:TonB family protein [Betaproteobacteria bacterium]
MAGPAPWERLAIALAISASAHLALLANAPFVPGLSEAALFAGRPLTARIAAAPADSAPQIPEPESQQQRQPEPLPQTPPEAAAEPSRAEAQASAAGLPAPEIFYRGSEVDERAVATNTPDIEYPERAFAAGTSGTVRLRLVIDHRGVLREASVLAAAPAGVFEEAALKAARSLRFRPAIRNGVAVGSIKLIEVPFDPDCMRTGSCIPEAGGAKAKP